MKLKTLLKELTPNCKNTQRKYKTENGIRTPKPVRVESRLGTALGYQRRLPPKDEGGQLRAWGQESRDPIGCCKNYFQAGRLSSSPRADNRYQLGFGTAMGPQLLRASAAPFLTTVTVIPSLCHHRVLGLGG